MYSIVSTHFIVQFLYISFWTFLMLEINKA